MRWKRDNVEGMNNAYQRYKDFGKIKENDIPNRAQL